MELREDLKYFKKARISVDAVFGKPSYYVISDGYLNSCDDDTNDDDNGDDNGDNNTNNENESDDQLKKLRFSPEFFQDLYETPLSQPQCRTSEIDEFNDTTTYNLLSSSITSSQ